MGEFSCVVASSLFLLLLITRVDCQRRNSSRSVVIKDIHSTVNDIFDTVHKTDSFLDVNLRTIASNVAVVQSKVERVADTVDLNKVNVNLVNEKLSKMEDRVKNVEQIVSNEMIRKFAEKMSSFETLIERLNESVDGKLRKMNNVLTKVYEFSKDMRNVIEEAKDARNGEEDVNLNSMQKDIKEQISILGVETKTQMNSLTTNLMNLRSQVDLIGSQLLMIHDDIPKRTAKNSVENFLHASSSAQSNCPGNLSELANALNSNHKSLMSKIDVELNRIERKVGRVCVDSRSEPNDQNDVALGREKAITSIKPITGNAPPTCTRITRSVSSSSCYQFRKEGADCDGIYELALRNKRAKVYCDMTDSGGGWTVIMRRGKFANSGGVPFNKTWDEYKNGFGELDNEFWLGNELIQLLTTTDANELQIDLESSEAFISIRYELFQIGPEIDDFKLKIGKPKNGDHYLDKVATSFINHGGKKFSTFDRNNSGNMVNCAEKFKGGWWFDDIKCFYVFLNAPHSSSSQRRSYKESLAWPSWKDANSDAIRTLEAVQMKIRTKH